MELPYKISRGVQYQLLADIGSLTMHFPIFTCRLPSHSFNVQLKFIFKKKKITKFSNTAKCNVKQISK